MRLLEPALLSRPRDPKSPREIVHGTVARGFERVRAVFLENLKSRDEVGAAFAVYRHGEKVVDLWGGARDHATGAPWEHDTVVMMYSATKGMLATAFAVAHSRGHIDYDATVAQYWPEFAQHGKQAITVRQLLSHEAGLPWIDRRLDIRTLGDLDAMAEILAAQRPQWEPGARRGYHASSLGFYANELLRRADPKHRSLGEFFQQEIAATLGVAYHIGLPQEFPLRRLARIRPFQAWEAARSLHHLPVGFLIAYLRDPLTRRTLDNPAARHPAELDCAEFHRVESPASNGIGEARALARIYGELATGGKALGLQHATLEELSRYPRDPPGGRVDRVLNVESVFSLGFSRPSDSFRFGVSRRAFGAPGAGGSFGFADPDMGVGYGYVMNRIGYCLSDDPREVALRRATYACLGVAAK
jgi:CubicO group peptidase (beta-lactamase class C family)